MPYPDTPATLDEIENNPVLKRELFIAINRKPEAGFKMISDICNREGLDEDATGKKIASFYLNNKDNLDQAKVADHISGKEDEHKKLMKHFVDAYAPEMQGKGFVDAMRGYFDNFKAPGEGQKVDRFISAFASAYVQQNPDMGIPNADTAYQMSYATVQLNSDAHNPANKTKMTYPQYKDNLEYSMKLQKLDTGFLATDSFLENIYKDVQAKELSPTFKKEEPRLELDGAGLKKDKTLGKLGKELGKKNGMDMGKALGLDGVTATASARKPALGFLTGYKSTVTLTDQNGNKATVEISKPGLFSRKPPTVTVKPVGEDDASLKFASQVASRFQSSATCKSSFAYQRDELATHLPKTTAVQTGVKVEKSEGVKQSQPKQIVKNPSQEQMKNMKKELAGELSEVLGKQKVGDILKASNKNKKTEGVSVQHGHGKGFGGK